MRGGSVMQADLRFAGEEAEAAFFDYQTERNHTLETQFHYARALAWFAVLLRSVGACDWTASAVIAAGTVTTLLPAFAHRLPRAAYLRWRASIQVFDNLLQVLLGVYTHDKIYPNPEDGQPPNPFQMVAVMLTGNGVAWQLFCSLWGSLPFRYALPQQAALTIILLLHNRVLCRRSSGIQHGYAALAQWARRRVHRLTPPGLLQAGQRWLQSASASRSCAAAVLSAPAAAAEAVRLACTQAEAATAAQSALLLEESIATPAARGAKLCLRYQPVSLLLLGFVVPTLYIWHTELRMRRAFLAARAPADGRRHVAAAVAALGPSLFDYLMFAGPAVACMYSFVVVPS